MKKINARVTTKNIIIAEITISDEEKKLIDLTCDMIANKYMEQNHPETTNWYKCSSFYFDGPNKVTGHWIITIYEGENELTFEEQEQDETEETL